MNLRQGGIETDFEFKFGLNKVPEVTLYFWIIKILCTTTGETGADYLIENFLGLVNTTYFMSILLLLIIYIQFKVKKYTPIIYWSVVVFLSVVGTLITDLLTDKFHVSLVTSSFAFSLALGGTFLTWFISEKTLSIHSIKSKKRELFYWLTILFTFSLGTALGDLVAEKYSLGYLTSTYIFLGIIALITIIFYIARFFASSSKVVLNSGGVLAFWLAYIFTRPLGASIGDYLSQARNLGGLGLGTTSTSLVFLSIILVLVIYLSLTKKDQIKY